MEEVLVEDCLDTCQDGQCIIIIDEFKKQGVTKFYITLNNKGKMIKLYLDNIVKDVNNLQIEKSEKHNIIEKLFEIKDKLKI